MDVLVLGALRVENGNGEIAVPGTKERTVLALLAANVGQSVAADAIIDTLWPQEPPRTAIKTARTYIARLRAMLSDPGLIVTEGHGYRLTVAADGVDADRFARLAALGISALAQGRLSTAADTFGEALALWRGPPYAGFEETAFGAAERRRLTELHRHVLEGWYTARMKLGDSAVAADIESRLGADPLREPLWVLLARAHAAAGDQAAALEALRRDWRSARSAAVDLAADRTLVPPLPTAPLTASAAAITPDGAMMVAATYSGFTGEAVLQRVALPTGDVLPEVAMPWFVIGLAVMQDSTSAIVHGQYGIARVDLASGEVALNRPLPPSDLEFNAWPYSAQLSPDGTKVSLIRGKQMLVLDTGTLEEVASWETGDYDYTYAAAWLGDAALAHGGSAGVVHIRSVPEGQAEAGPLDAAPGDVCALASDPAGAVMASLASDGSVLLWDVPSAAPIGEPMRARPDLGCGWLRFTGTGEAMLLQQFDASGALVTWPVDSPTLLARACALAGREPDQQQWRSWHGGTPQRPTCGDLLQTDLLRG
jgi:DNA-binding SARP family transcriptional activator